MYIRRIFLLKLFLLFRIKYKNHHKWDQINKRVKELVDILKYYNQYQQLFSEIDRDIRKSLEKKKKRLSNYHLTSPRRKRWGIKPLSD